LGIDTLIGGLGDDIYVVDNTGDVVKEILNQGYDSVSSSVSYVLPVNVEQLWLDGTTAINGTGNTLDNSLYGNDGNNKLIGNAGKDYLEGGKGIDTMIGGLGDDQYDVTEVGDLVTELANQGIDLVWSTINYTLLANVEWLGLYGASAINGTGNDLANKVNGNDAANVLKGNAGDDSMKGFAGNDILDGGVGNDTLVGGVGSDTFKFTSKQGVDVVQDFVAGEDIFKIENSVFTALKTSGTLTTGEFISGAGLTSAAEANDYLIYNSTSGALYYDADGNGAGGTLQIAMLGVGLALTNVDFAVI
jgi:Ca2+-binding RTX toxin-like protein